MENRTALRWGTQEVGRLTAAPEAFTREAEEVDIRIEWVPLADVVEAVLAGRMRNGILVAGVFAAAERLRRG